MGDDNLDLTFKDYSSNLQVFQNELTNVEIGAKLTPIRDTTSTSTQSVTVNGVVYPAQSGRPILMQPGETAPGGLDHAANLLKNFPDQILAFLDNLPTIPEDPYPDLFDEEIADVGQATLAKIGNGNAKKGTLMLRFAALHPDAKVPKELADLAATVREKTDKAAGHGPSELLISVEDGAINALAEWHFQEEVMSLGLSESDQKALFFAHNVPNAAANLSPTLQAALKKAEAAATSKTQNDTGFPEGWLTDPDTKGYEAKLGTEFSSKVENSLSSQLMKGQITKAQYNELRTLLFLPDTDTPHKATLEPILKELMAQATEGMQKDYSFPSNYSCKIDAAGYNGILNMAFSAEFSKQIGDPKLNLSPEQQALLKGALLSDQAAEALPADLKAIFGNVKAAAIAKLGATYGVPSTWTYDSKILSTAAERANDPKLMGMQVGINQIKEWLGNAKKAVDLVASSGAGGHTLMLITNYMKSVSLALTGMQEMLYEMQTTDANMSQLMNKVQNDEKVGELKKQAKDLKEIIDKQKKMEALGPLKAIFQWVIMLFLVMFLGPVGMAIAAVLMLATGAQAIKSLHEGKSLWNVLTNMNFIDGLAQTFKDIGKLIGGPFGDAFGRITLILTLALMYVVCPQLVMADMMIGGGDIVKNLLLAFNVPKQAAETVAMAIQITYQVVMMVVMVILTAGASLMATIAKIGQTLAKAALDIVQKIKDLVRTVIKFLASLLENISQSMGENVKGISDGLKAGQTSIERALQSLISYCENVIQKGKEIDVAADAVDAAKKIEKTAEATLKNAQDLANSKNPPPGADKLVQESQEGLDLATDTVKKAKTALKEITDASEKLQKEFTDWVAKIETVTDLGKTLTEQIPNIQNNILQAIIERIRGAMDAAMVLVEQFVKLMKELVKKLMQMVNDAASTIKNIGEDQEKNFSDANRVTAALFQG